MCGECCKELLAGLSAEAKKALELLPASKGQVQLQAGLSYSVCNRVFVELTAVGFVGFEERGRAKVYSLTESGRKAQEKPSKGPLEWKLPRA